jgi:bifunctional DNA-binding transcriptional regulator/antitoxin component of YhaV-PrlF toxin-antitoxin module
MEARDLMTQTKIVRPLRNGQITIPIEFRREMGWTEETALQVTLDGKELRIKLLSPAEPGDNRQWLRELYEYFAPARQEAIERGYTDEEINEWIDEAVREVRARRG